MTTKEIQAETAQKPVYSEKARPIIQPLTEDRSKDPLELQLFFARNPGLKKNLTDALNAGFHVNFHREKTTPDQLRSAFQNLVIANGDLNTFTAEALVAGKDIPQTDYIDHATGETQTANVEDIRQKAKDLLRLEIVESEPYTERPAYIG